MAGAKIRVSSTEELGAAIMKELAGAMGIAEEIAQRDMERETHGFYMRGTPKRYRRTGALGNTPETSGVSVGRNTVAFDAYLDQSHDYTTGSWDMPTVLKNAEAGTGGILGRSGFWERAEKAIGKDVDRILGKFFKKA